MVDGRSILKVGRGALMAAAILRHQRVVTADQAPAPASGAPARCTEGREATPDESGRRVTRGAAGPACVFRCLSGPPGDGRRPTGGRPLAAIRWRRVITARRRRRSVGSRAGSDITLVIRIDGARWPIRATRPRTKHHG